MPNYKKRKKISRIKYLKLKKEGNKLKLYIVRHGQTEWNVLEKFQGQLNSPLTEAGIEKVRETCGFQQGLHKSSWENNWYGGNHFGA